MQVVHSKNFAEWLIEMNSEEYSALEDWLRSRRLQIEADIEDLGDLRPLLRAVLNVR